MAKPMTFTRGAPGTPVPLASWSNPPMNAMPDTSTSMSSGTVIWMPPISVYACSVTSGSLKRASRRSSSTPPITATAT